MFTHFRNTMHSSRPRITLITGAMAGGVLTVSTTLSGCATPPASQADKVKVPDGMQQAADREFAREPFADQARAAIIRQAAIFESHFKPDSASLTSRGERDLTVLADALKQDGGRISVRRGSASEALYEQRLDTVRRMLVGLGISDNRITLDDKPPGGSGVSTAQAMVIRARIAESPMKPLSDGQVLSPYGGNSGSMGSP
jgi:outer membrane protein OmpA-like peptidoglycan-associated protein